MNHSRFTRTAVVHCMGCKLGYTCISLCTLHLYHTTISNNSYLFPVNRISCRAHIKLLVGMSVSFKPPISTAAPLFVFSASLDRMCVAMSSASHSHTPVATFTCRPWWRQKWRRQYQTSSVAPAWISFIGSLSGGQCRVNCNYSNWFVIS